MCRRDRGYLPVILSSELMRKMHRSRYHRPGALSAAQAQYQLAQTTMARYEALHRENAVSDLTMDQTRNSYEVARAQMDQAQAALARTQNNLGFTVLRADRDGLIGSTLYEEGQVVSAGTPVVEIVDDSKKDVYISLPEKQYSQYSVGMPCTVTFWRRRGLLFPALSEKLRPPPTARQELTTQKSRFRIRLIQLWWG